MTLDAPQDEPLGSPAGVASGINTHGPRHALGLAITVFAVTVMSFDTVLLKLIDKPLWTVLAWRGLLMGAVLFAVLLLLRGPARIVRDIGRFGAVGVAAMGLYALNATAFVAGLERTGPATLLVIMAATPLFAAVASALVFGARTPARTWIAALLGLVGIVLTAHDWVAGGSAFGIACCLTAATGLGLYLAILEHVHRIDAVTATALGGTVSGCVGFVFAGDLTIEGPALVYTLLLGCVVVPLAFALFSLGPRMITAPEAGLILLLEAILGPLWVWLILQVPPADSAVLGGTIILTTLVWHGAMSLRSARAMRAGRRRVVPH